MTPSDPAPAMSRDGVVPAPPSGLDDLPGRPLVALAVIGLCVALAVVSLVDVDADIGSRSARAGVAGVVLLGGIVLASGWTRVVDLPSRKGTALVALVGSFSTTAALLLPPAPSAEGGPVLGWLPAALAVSVITAFAHQLLRTDGRPRVVASLSGSLLALALLASGACWIGLTTVPGGRLAVAAGAAGVAAGVLLETVVHRFRRTAWTMPLAMAAGGAAAAALAQRIELPWADGLVLGVVASAVAFCVQALLAPLPQLAARRGQIVSAAASTLAPGAAVYAVARLFLA